MRRIVVLILCVICMVACARPHNVFVRSYVLGYYEIEHFDFEQQGGEYIMVDIGRIPGSVSGRVYTWSVTYNSKSEDKERYNALCEKHNDISYNREVEMILGYIQHQYLATDFRSIDIISDSDYNNTHLAGSSLGDIIRFYSLSPATYINSGYKTTYNWKEADEEAMKALSGFTIDSIIEESLHPVHKLISELTPDDLYLLGDGERVRWGFFKFEELPTLSREHKITITMTADDGKVYSGKVDMVFD